MTLTADQWITGISSPRPRATDNFGSGLYRMSKDKAVLKTHVQYNSAKVAGALLFDLDHEDSEYHVKSLMWDEGVIPEPSWMTLNPHTGHAHLGYLLAEPVTKTDAARRHPIEYAASVERTLHSRLGADSAYTGVTTRSPLHPSHTVLWGPGELYTLGGLHSALGELDKPGKVARADVGLGRNVSLFNAVRERAYSEFSKHSDPASFERAVLAIAVAFNGEFFECPLSRGEVAGLARSISRWTWRTFTRNAELNSYSKIQRERAYMRKDALRRQAAVRQIRAMYDAGEALSVEQIMDAFSVSRTTAFAYLNDAGLVEDTSIGDRPVEVKALREQGLSYGQIMDRTGLTKSQVRYALRKA